MNRFTSSAHCRSSPHKVWAVLTDWQRGLRWRPGMEAVSVSGEPTNARLEWTSRGAKRTAEVTHWLPPHQLTLHYVQGPVHAEYRWTVQAEHGGSRVTLEVTTSAQGATRMMLPVFTEMIRRSDEVLPTALCAEVER